MANHLFNSLKNKFGKLVSNGNEEKVQSEAPQKTDKPVGEPPLSTEKNNVDYIDLQQRMTEDITANIRTLLKTSNFHPEEYTLALYINDALTYQSCLSAAYKRSVEERLSMEYNCTFKKIVINQGIPPTDLARYAITGDAYLTLEKGRRITGTNKARIKALGGNGSLIDNEFILDSQELDELPGKRYNIGIGKTPKLDIGIIRINHIAIDDNPNIPEFSMNKYVSRSHAHIRYKDTEGFILYVEEGGTPVCGKRTMVYRNGKPFRMDVAGMGLPLQHGDQVVLSKQVILYFENIKE